MADKTDKITEIFNKMTHHQDLIEHFTKLKDRRLACHHKMMVKICDLELQTLFFGVDEVTK